MTDIPPFDPKALRQVLGTYVTGVTIVTTLDAHARPAGLTVNSFTSVSIDPPLVLWSQSLSAPSFPVFESAERFAVSILSEAQAAISERFCRAGTDKFTGIATRPGLGGIPLIEGAAAYLECRREAIYPGGDHAMILGRVERMTQCHRAPLVFGGGTYRALAPLATASMSAA